MSRIRSIKPDFWSSEQVISLSRDARLLFIGMWNFADDAGRLKLNPVALKAQIFPGDDDLTKQQVVDLVSEIIRGGLLECYTNDLGTFGEVTGWKKHQRIDKPQAPKCPGLMEKESIRRTFGEYSKSVLGTFATDREIGEKGKERSDPRACALDPAPSAPSEPAVRLPAPHDPEPTETWTASAQRIAFVQAYEHKMRTTPSLGGKQVGDFHASVLRTAELQRRDVAELFTETLTKWLDRPHSETERRAPYACFCQAWGDLTNASPSKPEGGGSGPGPRKVAPSSAFKPTDFRKILTGNGQGVAK